MKQIKTTFLAILLFAVIVSCCACSGDCESQVDFFTNAPKMYLDTKSTNCLSFNIAMFSKKKIKQIDFVGFEGTDINSDNYAVTITENMIDELTDYKHDGYYIKCYMFDIRSKNDVQTCDFDRIVLNVDGTRQTLDFASTVHHEYTEGNVFSDALRISVVPNEMAADFINNSEQGAVYEFVAMEDLTLQGVRFDNFIQTTNIYCAIGESDGQIAEFPLSVRKGETVKLAVSFQSEYADCQSYVMSSIYFDYITAAGNHSDFNSAVVTFDPIFPITEGDTSHIDKLIDELLDKCV